MWGTLMLGTEDLDYAQGCHGTVSFLANLTRSAVLQGPSRGGTVVPGPCRLLLGQPSIPAQVLGARLLVGA